MVENCGALPDQLLESELFGHKRGAFTGATEDHVGLFERASGGTVFLDEIGEISPPSRSSCCASCRNRRSARSAGSKTRKIDVRVIAATNRDLAEEVRTGRFRADLYYRWPARSSPAALRERPATFRSGQAVLAQASSKLGKPAEGFAPDAMARLVAYQWPGNVRELQNVVQQMLVASPGPGLLDLALVPPSITAATPMPGAHARRARGRQRAARAPARPDRHAEADIISETLMRHQWNKSRAAEELGLSRVGLRAKMEKVRTGEHPCLQPRKSVG